MDNKEVKSEIDRIIKERYGNYNGRIFLGLRVFHNAIRSEKGDVYFLNLLNNLQKELPRPVFTLPNLKKS